MTENSGPLLADGEMVEFKVKIVDLRELLASLYGKLGITLGSTIPPEYNGVTGEATLVYRLKLGPTEYTRTLTVPGRKVLDCDCWPDMLRVVVLEDLSEIICLVIPKAKPKAGEE